MTVEVLAIAIGVRLLAATAKLAMAALALYIRAVQGTSRPRLWLLVAVGETLPAGALILESAALAWGFGEWVYGVNAMCAIGMAVAAGAAWMHMTERSGDGLSAGSPEGLGEADLNEIIRRAELRGEARVYANALLARAGPPRMEA